MEKLKDLFESVIANECYQTVIWYDVHLIGILYFFIVLSYVIENFLILKIMRVLGIITGNIFYY